MAARIALLRGINIGPRKRVPMPALRSLLEGAGYRDVRTYVQSGNVVLESDEAPESLAASLAALIEGEFGFPVPVVVRTRDELAAVVADNPLGDVADVPRFLHVVFLALPLSPEARLRVEALAVEPERVVVREREIHVWYPEGMGRSKLARHLADSRLGTVGTDRNWATVLALLELAGG